MADTFQPVKPGDLITADMMNRILTALTTLNTRVAALEGAGSAAGGTVTITGLSPSVPVPMGSELRVFGKNFGLPTLNVVTVDGNPVSLFKAGSNDALLIFDVPAVQGVPQQGGKLVTLTISNQHGFASTTFTVVQALPTIPQGNLFVTYSQAPTEAQLNPGNSYIYVFTVQAITNMTETYTLTPTVDQSGWQATVIDNSGNPLSPSEVAIPKGDPPLGSSQNVRIRLAIPTGAAVGTTAVLRLTVTSKLNPSNLTTSSADVTNVVGSPPPPTQTIAVTFSSQAGGGFDGTSVVVPTTNTMIAVNFSALFKDAGTYTISPPTIESNPSSLWTAQLMGAASLNIASPNASVMIVTGVSAQSGAAATNLVLRITRADNSTIFGEVQQPIRT